MYLFLIELLVRIDVVLVNVVVYDLQYLLNLLFKLK